MYKLLIATSNQDKFRIVSSLLQKIGLIQFEFYSLKMINQVSNLSEIGNVEERAKQKAYEFKNLLPEYDVIVGIDDGILLPNSNEIDTELKKILKQIINDKILRSNDCVSICRAFCLLTKQKEYNILTKIPFIYQDTDNVIIKPNSYPLSQVLSPINSKKRVTDLTEKEEMDYYIAYCKKNFQGILSNFTRIFNK